MFSCDREDLIILLVRHLILVAYAFRRIRKTDYWFFVLTFIFTFTLLISLCLLCCTITWILFDPLYEEIVTNTSDLKLYIVSHFFLELVLPLSIFIGVMLTLLHDWNWIPISSLDRTRGKSLEEVKRKFLEWFIYFSCFCVRFIYLIVINRIFLK